MIQMNPSVAWLQEKAAQEGNTIVSVGGLVRTLEAEEALHVERAALAKLIELRRRQYHLSIEELAGRANIDLEQVAAIERGEGVRDEPHALRQLAKALHLPGSKLLQLAGLAEVEDDEFRDAALRFAACPEPVPALLPEERMALEEFVKVLAEE